jgi:hypothetical protein
MEHNSHENDPALHWVVYPVKWVKQALWSLQCPQLDIREYQYAKR